MIVMENFMVILTILAAYLIGSISSAVIISKIISGEDIRDHGSGNAGATNMLRVHGKLAGILTLIFDILKGVIAIGLAMLFALILSGIKPDNTYGACLKYLAGLFVVIGHDFPLFFKFRGGKGVATSLGVILLLNWQIGVTVLIIAIIIMALSRYVSLGSVVAAIIYPILLTGYIMGAKGFENAKVESQYAIVTGIIMALLLIIKHRSNLKRLAKGTENKLFSKKKGSANK